MKKVFEFIKQNVITLFSDKIRLAGIVTCLVLAGLHLYQYYASGMNINCMYRVMLFGALGFFAIFFGVYSAYVILCAFSFMAVWINTFNNYTSFFCILLASRIVRKTEPYLVVAYVINVVFAYLVTDLQMSHLIIHLCTCMFFYNLYFFVNQPKKLNLKDDEISILEELAEGKEMKAIESFTPNVAYNKLKKARERNNISTNEELQERYKQEMLHKSDRVVTTD